MNVKRIVCVFVVLGLPLVCAAQPAVQEKLVVDIVKAGDAVERLLNTTVTVVGQVQSVTANPQGTNRGTYALLDDSCNIPLTIRTSELPPVSQIFRVTGVIIFDDNKAPILREISRSASGMSSTMRYLLIAAGVLFAGLIVWFGIVLMKQKKPGSTAATHVPAARPGSIPRQASTPVDSSQTPAAPSAAGPGKTQFFLSLGADIVVDRGPDKDKAFPLHQPVTTIGRTGSRNNDIELSDETISKEQASIYYDTVKKTFSVVNESTTNPTRVNGQPVSGPTVVDNGALIEIGRTVLRLKKG